MRGHGKITIDTEGRKRIQLEEAGKTSSLRLGIPRDYFYEGLHAEIQAALTVLRKLTASLRETGTLTTSADDASIVDPYRTTH